MRKIKLAKNKNVMLASLLFISTLFLFSCSNEVENEDVSDAELDVEQTVDKDMYQQKKVDIMESTDEEIRENFPVSQAYTSPLKSSNVMTVAIDASSETEREVLQALSEFEAIDTDEGVALTLPDDILFDFDSNELRDRASETINKLLKIIDQADGDITIIGHTDSKGEDSYNQKLSEERATVVLDALNDSGVKNERLHAEGKGASDPVAKNVNSDGSDNPDGRQKNRRVEVIVEDFNE